MKETIAEFIEKKGNAVIKILLTVNICLLILDVILFFAVSDVGPSAEAGYDYQEIYIPDKNGTRYVTVMDTNTGELSDFTYTVVDPKSGSGFSHTMQVCFTVEEEIKPEKAPSPEY